ncbi:MAG TPA: hypothetical protein PKN96_04185 [Flavobacterium sp.]|uniref:hypothetical protein n=1 Tax=Flavobacterium sp. TaxID=239 RepID=UPI002C2FCD5D|nr:hypothetical protein [Flavobacterium sp.]HNP32465.1 hypothetical protein [Flavobacterium sp.]
MKNSFKIIIALFCSVFGFGQNNKVSNLDTYGIRLSETHYSSSYSSTQGSPYLNKAFLHAKVGDLIQNALMRYDAANDQFEFITATNDTLILNKTGALGDISFSIPKATYQLVNYTERDGKKTTGYLVKLYEKNNFTLYKRQKVKYYPATAAKSSYDTASPARFDPMRDTFFLKRGEGEIIELPSGKKGILKLFPEKKDDLEAFIKQNDLDLEKERDVIMLIDFLASL